MNRALITPQSRVRKPIRLGSAFWMSDTSGLAIPAIVYLFICYLVPIILILTTSVTNPSVGLGNFASALSGLNAITLLKTLAASIFGACVVALLGYPVAYFIHGCGSRLQKILLVGVIAPYMTSVLVRTFAWQVILGRLGPIPTALRAIGFDSQGMLQTWPGLILGIVQIVLPLFILPVLAVMRQVDNSSIKAARSLGAGPAETFWRVFFPQTFPGIEVGLILSFVSLAGSFVLPVILGGHSATMTGVLINNQLNEEGLWGPASASAIVLALSIFILIGLFHAFMSTQRRWIAIRAGSGHAVNRRRKANRLAPLVRILDRLGVSRHRWPLLIVVVIVESYLFLPQLISVPVSFSGTETLVFPPHSYSFDWYREFGTAQWLGPLVTSLVVAPTSALIATALGGLAAFGLERTRYRRVQSVAGSMLLLPMVIPIVVVSVGFYLALVQVNLNDTIPGLVLAEATIALPIAFVVCRASVQSLDPTFERAGLSLGAKRRVVLRRIVLPLVRAAILVALLFAFLLVFDDVVIPLFVTAVEVIVLPRQMYAAVAQSSDPTIAVVGVLSLVVSMIILGISLRLDRRSKTSTLSHLSIGTR